MRQAHRLWKDRLLSLLLQSFQFLRYSAKEKLDTHEQESFKHRRETKEGNNAYLHENLIHHRVILSRR